MSFEPTIRTLEQIFAWFKRGLYPKQEHFWDTFFSFWHKEDKIPTASVDGLDDKLNNKYDKDEGRILERRMGEAEETLEDHANRFDGIYDRLDEAEERLDDHDEHLEKHDGEISTLQQDVIDLDLHLAEHDRTLADHDTRIKGNAAEIVKLHATDAEQAKTLSDHETRIKTNADTGSKNATAITELQKGQQTLNSQVNNAGQRITNLETTTGQHAEKLDGFGKDITKLYEADGGMSEQITELSLQIRSLQLDGKVVPLKMVVYCPETITLRNKVPFAIRAELRPDYVLQNVLFLGDDRAVGVDPTSGEITVKGKGESVVHVVPTENVALTQKKTIKVINPSALLNGDGSLLLDVDWKIFTT